MTETQRARAVAIYRAVRVPRRQPLIDRQKWRGVLLRYCAKFGRIFN
jgi:hypothetical protein